MTVEAETDRVSKIAPLEVRFDHETVDALFASIDHSHLPGAAIAVAIDGKPVYRRGFGRANLELPVLLDTTTRMRIGSITKHFTCLLYLLLCDEGLADLDDPIGRHVEGLAEATGRCTVRDLMGHLAGIRDILDISMVLHGTGKPITDRQMLDYYRTIQSTDFRPRDSWSYNNGGYILLTAAIEKITGAPLDLSLRMRLFEPLGMHDTMLRRWDSDFVSNCATLHMIDRQGRYSRDYMGMELSGVGGLISTMDDMLRWLRHMDAPIIGSERAWRTMSEPQRLSDGHATNYGFGLITGTYRGTPTLSHGGTVLGGNAQMIKVPAAKLDICIATNRGDASATMLAYRVIDNCVTGLEPSVECALLPVEDRIFRSSVSGRIVELSVQRGKALIAIDGGGPLPIAPCADGSLKPPAEADFVQTAFVPTPPRLVQFGKVEILDAIRPETDVHLGPRAGRYRSDEVDIMLEVGESGDGPCLISRGRHGSARFRLVPITTELWRAESCEPLASAGAMVSFAEGERSLHLSTGRTRRLFFERIEEATDGE